MNQVPILEILGAIGTILDPFPEGNGDNLTLFGSSFIVDGSRGCLPDRDQRVISYVLLKPPYVNADGSTGSPILVDLSEVGILDPSYQARPIAAKEFLSELLW